MLKLSRGWDRLPAALAWALLAVQAVIPWTTGHYITEDGPSHLYNALILKNLLLHPHGLYAAVYHFQARLVTNWSTPLLLGLLTPVFGTAHAEAALASLCVLLGFGCITYFRRSVDGASPGIDPLTNFLLNSWFFWVGFYNFYLGMALCFVLVGFYMRHSAALDRRRAAALGAGLLILFFTHVLPALLAMMAVVLLFAWGVKAHWKTLLGALAPAAVVMGFYLRAGLGRVAFHPEVAWAWNSFPMQVFAVGRGRTGGEELLVPAMLLLLAAGFLGMQRQEWLSPRGAMAAAALASFAGYLILPDAGFGGNEIKVRMAWAVFLFGCPAAASSARMRDLWMPASIYIACFVAANLIFSAQLVHKVGAAADAYASAMEKIPEASALVKVEYGVQGARDRFGYDAIADEPLFHADALMAANHRLIDLTDYQALSRVFPVTLRKEFSGSLQNSLRSLEDGASAGFEPLPKILGELPVPADYVVLVGDQGSDAVRRSEFGKTRDWLDTNLEPVSAVDFVRVYRRRIR